MGLQAVKGGWVNDSVTAPAVLFVERKSKYKNKVTFKVNGSYRPNEVREWCEQMFGPGGRSNKCSWRVGWTDKDDTYYFKRAEDATMFVMRWS